MRTVIYVSALTITNAIMQIGSIKFDDSDAASIAVLLCFCISIDVIEFYMNMKKSGK